MDSEQPLYHIHRAAIDELGGGGRGGLGARTNIQMCSVGLSLTDSEKKTFLNCEWALKNQREVTCTVFLYDNDGLSYRDLVEHLK